MNSWKIPMAVHAGFGRNDTYWSLGYDCEKSTGIAGSHDLEHSQALNRFFRDVEKKAFRMAQIATNDPEEALDIVQDTMFKLVEKYASKDPSEWTPLFYRILQSRINDWYRRTRVRNRFRVWFSAREEEAIGDPIENAMDEAGRSPEQLLETNADLGRLEQALGNLSLRQQQVFLLRAWEGMDVRQTAKVLGCSEGSVKTHYSRALQALRNELDQYWYDNEQD